MANDGSAGLDTKRYDRQIRLWGMETQLRMSTTRVLLAGAGGLAAEVAKNLVLAGVGHVTLRDHALVTADDLDRGGQFLLAAADVGRNRAESSLAFLRGLNPSVEVVAAHADIRAASAAELAAYDLVIATELDLADLLALGARVREARALDAAPSAKRARDADEPEAGAGGRRVHLMGACCSGLYGSLFVDLGRYSYTESTVKKGKDGETTTETRAAAINYPTLKEAVAQLRKAKQPAEIAAILTVQRAHLAGCSLADAAAHTCALAGLASDLLSAAQLEALAPHAAPALAPLCAILGGLIGQEVIKVISGKDTPIDNLLCLDAVAPAPNGGARVVRLAPAE